MLKNFLCLFFVVVLVVFIFLIFILIDSRFMSLVDNIDFSVVNGNATYFFLLYLLFVKEIYLSHFLMKFSLPPVEL